MKVKLYIISLWFLFFILLILKADIPICFKQNSEFIGVNELISSNKVSLFALFMMILGAFYYFSFNRAFTKGATLLPKKIIAIKNLNSDTLSFLATYLIPLACYDMDKPRSFIVLMVLLLLIGWIYIKTNLFYTNPTLAVLGFKVYMIDTDGTKEMIVVIKETLKKGDYILPRQIDDKIYYSKKSTL